MSTVGSFDKTKHLDELDDPFFSNEGVIAPADRRKLVRDNLSLNMVVAIPDAATYTVLAADSGKTHVFPDFTATCTATLPAAAAGLEYVFMYGGAAADAQNFVIVTGSSAFYIGGVVHLDSDSTGDNVAAVYSDGNSNDTFTMVTPEGGTMVRLVSDGTNWYLGGTVVSATVCTIAD